MKSSQESLHTITVTVFQTPESIRATCPFASILRNDMNNVLAPYAIFCDAIQMQLIFCTRSSPRNSITNFVKFLQQ